MKDKIIRCQDCHQEFVFTIGEQKFFSQKALSEPTRCMICRGAYEAAKKDKFRGRRK